MRHGLPFLSLRFLCGLLWVRGLGLIALLAVAGLWGRPLRPESARAAVGGVAVVPAPVPQAAKLRPPLPSRGLSVQQVPLLGPHWRRGFTDYSAGSSSEVFQVGLPDALVVREGATLLRLRLADGVVTARHKIPGGSAGYDSGVAAADHVITTGNGAVLALDGTTLTQAWRFSPQSVATTSLLAVGVDRVLAVSSSAKFEAPYTLDLLDAATGKLLWSRRLEGDRRFCSFYADAERIYSSCVSKSTPSQWPLIALDAAAGTELWHDQTDSNCRELITNGVWLAWSESYRSRIVVANAATGARIRSVAVAQSNAQDPPTIAFDGGDLLYVDSQAVALDVETGRERWRTGNEFDLYTTLAVAEQVYVLDKKGLVQVRDRARGELLWQWNTGVELAAAILPDAGGTRPLVLLGRSGLLAFAPRKRPIPVEHAIVTGHIYNRTPAFKLQEPTLYVGRATAHIDDHGNYRVVVQERGALRFEVSGTGDGYTTLHNVRRRCGEDQDCPALLPLTGSGRYRVDLDATIIPHDCH